MLICCIHEGGVAILECVKECHQCYLACIPVASLMNPICGSVTGAFTARDLGKPLIHSVRDVASHKADIPNGSSAFSIESM